MNKTLAIFATIALLIGVAAMAAPTANAAAATTPDLGTATTFGILASTYTNTAPGTTISGDLGYTTGPLVAPTVNGTTHPADGTYAQAGIWQGNALTALNAQPCSFTFAPGAIDLATDATHGTIGIYAPGVYCVTGAASIGAAGITLTGTGTYIFRVLGALTTVTGSVVGFASGASACNVFWTPTAATTLAANTTFLGTDIDAAGITIGDTVLWTGRALAFGGTVSTVRDTITVPSCAVPAPAGTVPPTCAPGFAGTFPQCVPLQTSVPFPTSTPTTAPGGGGFSGGGTPGPSATPVVSTPTIAPATATPKPAAQLPSTTTSDGSSMVILGLLLASFAAGLLLVRRRERRVGA